MIKGLLFGGCSFTWGQGLYFYSNLSNLSRYDNYAFSAGKITEAMIRHKNSLRFPRLVANHLNTFEVCKDDIGQLRGNGGSEDETFDYFDYLFNVERKFSYDDFSHIIIQLSNPYRNYFEFKLNNRIYKTKILDSHLYNGVDDDVVGGDEFDEYCRLHNYTIEDVEKIHLYNQYNRLKDRVIFYNSKNITVKIISWFDDVITNVKDDDFFNDKKIKINYNDKDFNTIMRLMDSDSDMVIESDFKNNKNITVMDRHPSKLCHEVIANSVINNLINKN